MKLYSRKFILLLITYAVISVAFFCGMLTEKLFVIALLSMAVFYYFANVWQKQIESITKEDILEIKEYILRHPSS
jgi:small-conductance mechanosensitive channel